VGIWQGRWGGPTAGNSTYTFDSNGTFSEQTEKTDRYTGFDVKTDSNGTYQFSGESLLLKPSHRERERINTKGVTQEKQSQGYSDPVKFSHVSLSRNELVIGPMDGAPEPDPDTEPEILHRT
jgi:hypothetical protein